MNSRLIFVLFFLVGLAGVLSFRAGETWKTESVPLPPQESSFALEPPSNSLKGVLTGTTGDVKKEGRGEDEFEDIDEDEEVVDGEKLTTGKQSSMTVRFDTFVEVALGPSSEIAFVNTLPSSFLVQQNEGTVTYTLSSAKYPLSVRSLHMLFMQNSGTSVVTTDPEDGTITIALEAGEGKIAIVDADNQTHVWDIKEGEQAAIDDAARLVRMR